MKHWLPGVWPGVWISSMGMSPTMTTSPLEWLTRSPPVRPVDFCTSSDSSACTWTGTEASSSSSRTPTTSKPIMEPPTWSAW